MEGTPIDDNLSEPNKRMLELLKKEAIRFSVFNLALNTPLKEHIAQTV